MSYIGRIIAVLFVCFNLVIWEIHQHVYFGDKELNIYELSFCVFYLGIGWFAGRMYDDAALKRREWRKNNEKFRAIFEKAGIGIVLLNKDFKIVAVNPKLIEMFGYSEDEFYEMSLMDMRCDEDTAVNNRNLMKELLAGKIDQYQLEKRYIRKDGQVLWARVTSSLLTYHEFDKVYVLGMLVDITEGKVAQQQLVKMNQKLEVLSNKDGLTGIANRRFFDEYFYENWMNASSNTSPLALIMLDIDCFKKFNDHYGHHQGDYCLKQVGAALEKTLRHPKDIVARYGGEEFAVLLPETDQGSAVVVAERLCQAVEELQILHEKSTVTKVVTVSVGIACMVPGLNETTERLIVKADQALYEAKNEGRNRVKMNKS